MKTTKTYNISDKEATKDMAVIKKTFKYSKLGITPEMAKAVNAHVKKYGIAQIWNYFGDADGRDPDWWDWKTCRVRKLKLKVEWVPVR
jgi:hypothetical protein